MHVHMPSHACKRAQVAGSGAVTPAIAEPDALNDSGVSARLCTCTPARLHACTPVRLHTCAPARLHACTSVRLHTCAPARLHPCTPVRLHACALARLRAGAPARLRACACAHPQVHMCMRACLLLGSLAAALAKQGCLGLVERYAKHATQHACTYTHTCTPASHARTYMHMHAYARTCTAGHLAMDYHHTNTSAHMHSRSYSEYDACTCDWAHGTHTHMHVPACMGPHVCAHLHAL